MATHEEHMHDHQSRPPWSEWVEKNSLPKVIAVSRPKYDPTRWQKRGPMSRRDWVRFYKWAAKNAIARHMRKEKKPKKPLDPREERRKRLNKKLPLEDRLKRTPALAEPRHPREKFELPTIIDYPYIPHIRYKEPGPEPEKGRPRVPITIPKVFQHIDLQMEYWTNLRFPIHPSTKMYKPSANIKNLSAPRITPPLNPHCPIPPPPPEYIPKRRKFTSRQWKLHKKRLDSYLACPRRLFNYDDIMDMQARMEQKELDMHIRY